MKKIAVVLLMMLSATGLAHAAGDVEAGKAKSITCGGCHGMDGNSFNPVWPKLAGQHESYIVSQLQAFKSGDRSDPLMSAQAAPLTDEDMANLAAYFASQTVKPGTGKADKVAAGKRVYMGGNLKTGVTACVGCHGPSGKGNPAANFPSLNGQQAVYVAKQLNDFKAGTRKNDLNEMMQVIAAKMSKAEIEEVAEYITGM